MYDYSMKYYMYLYPPSAPPSPSITLGGFGIDRFYLEHWGSAVGKLLSFGGLGVWSIVDVILVGVGFVGPADGSAYIY